MALIDDDETWRQPLLNKYLTLSPKMQREASSIFCSAADADADENILEYFSF